MELSVEGDVMVSRIVAFKKISFTELIVFMVISSMDAFGVGVF